MNNPNSLAIDSNNNVWVANYLGSTVTELDNSGNPLSPSTGFAVGLLDGPQAVETDGSGNVWIANANATTTNAVTELVGAAVPKVTPLAYGLNTGTLGTRP